MQERNRIQSSLYNLTSGFAYRLLIMVTAFVVRTVFVHCLSEDYLGINGLYSNVLSMLSLAELGFGTAMVYSMYQPLANKDYDKLSQLMWLYRKVYRIIGCVVLVLGLCLVPFLDILIKDKPNVGGLTFYYLAFLGDTVVSYWLFAYKSSILQADQKNYVTTLYQSAANLLKSFIQIILLICFRNYTLYLLTQIGCTILQNSAISRYVTKNYPAFKNEKNNQLSKEETAKIFGDVKALMLSRVAHVVLNSTGSLVISAFVGINWVGLLSNYTMISEAITGILTQLTSAISASLGNFFVKEDSESGYKLFRRVDTLNFWLYGFSSVALVALLNPFITLWIGESFVLGMDVVIALVLRFYVAGFMNTLWTFRSTLGLFTQGKFRPLLAAVVNIILSIGLSFRWGVAGVLAATVIARACVNLWYDPWLLHRDGFGKSVKPYYVLCLGRLLLLGGLVCAMLMISNVVFSRGVTWLSFVVMVLLTAVVPNAILLLLHCKTDEFRYFVQLTKSMLKERKKT